MKEKLIKKLCDLWRYVDSTDKTLSQEIAKNVNNGESGAMTLLDWCRSDYDNIQKQYMELHNLNEEQMEKVMEEHCGDYNFLYKEIPSTMYLEEIWDLCNWYLDYCNGTITEKEMLGLIEEDD